MKRRLFAVLLLAAVTLSLAACGQDVPEPTTAASAEPGAEPSAEPDAGSWVPDEMVTFMVPTGAGGSSDLFARKIADIAEKYGFCPVSINIENRSGGSSTVGFTYLNSLRDGSLDNYTLGITPPGFWTSPLSGVIDVYGIDDFAEISAMAADPLCVVVNSDSPFKTFSDVVEYAKDHPGELKCLGGGQLSDETILTYMINDLLGIELSYITMTDGSDVLAAALGNHADLYILNPADGAEHFTNGTLIPLAISTEEPVENFEDIPTFVEQGYDIVHQQTRALVMNSSVSQKVIDFYSDMLEKVAETPEWDEYLSDSGLAGIYLNSEDFDTYNDELVASYEKYIAMVLEDREE
jgi:putative tricarboxylic transport membrane protein